MNDKIRKSMNVILDSIQEINDIYRNKEKIKTNKETRSHFERLVEKIGEGINRIDKMNPHFKVFNDLRNVVSHEFEVNIDRLISEVDKNLTPLKEEIQGFISKMLSSNPVLKNFEKFGNIGEQKDRSKLIDALLDKLNEKDKEFRTKFPNEPTIQNYSKAIDQITDHPELLKLSSDNSIVATQIIESISEWARNTQKQIKMNEPFYEESEYLNLVRSLPLKDFYQNFKETEIKLKEIYKNNEINFSYYEDKISKFDKKLDVERIIQGELKKQTKGKVDLKNGIENFLSSPEFKKFEKDIPFNKKSYPKYKEKKINQAYDEANVLKNNFLKNWENELFKRKQKYELEQIEKARNEFINELYEKIKQFHKLKEILEPFTKDLGRLWDLSGGVWQNSGFEILKYYAKVMEDDQAINALAEMLGRYRKAEAEFEEIEIEKIVIKTKFKPRHATKGEVIGITESNDINSMLPVEIATLANPATKLIFLKKFAEAKLLTYEFRNQNVSSKEEIEQKEKQLKEKEESKGPIIICVDTSASMRGTPEQIAKTICFALTKIALTENRKCFLISFSTKIQTIELSDFRNSLDSLVKFLKLSFEGGTDPLPALEKALEMLETENFNKADILMVSDFIMDRLSDKLTKQISNAKQLKTKFHSLVIGSSHHKVVIENFDHNWYYDIKNKNGLINLVKDLYESKI
ncbi:MAG: VWA domain-containing protein [Leptospiraceae bacterium]|nr:VWA domain-containing protein [Leptospiraceae bacterium]